jgi:hypothetical protein
MVAKTLILAGTAFLAAAAASIPASAQQNAPGGGGPGVLSRMDTNRDGAVDRGEAEAALAAAFSRADRDNDGKLTAAELGDVLRALVGNIVVQQRLQNNGPGANGRRGFDYRFAPPRQGPNNPRGFGEPNNRPQFQPPFRPGFQAPFGPNFHGPRNQPQFRQPFRRGFQAPFGPRFQVPNNNPPQFQAPNGPRQGNRQQATPQGPQGQAPEAPQAAPTPPVAPGGPAPGPQGRGAPGVLPGFAMMDRNGDGVITPDEFAAAVNRGPNGR